MFNRINWHRVFHEFTEDFQKTGRIFWQKGVVISGSHAPDGSERRWLIFDEVVCSWCGHRKLIHTYFNVLDRTLGREPTDWPNNSIDNWKGC